MQTDQIAFAAFTPDHLDGAVLLSRAAGWPHRREDWAMVLELSTGFVALDGDRVAGTTMLTRYGTDAATINLVIVDAALRGRGIGRRLLERALREAGDRTCRLVATQDGLKLYESLGFRAEGEIAQHHGILGAVPDIEGVDWTDLEAEAAALDQLATGMDRRRLIEALFREGRVASLGGAGFAAVRAFGRGAVAGPVVAATVADAQALLKFVFAACAGSFMRVDTPPDRGLGPFLVEHGLAPVDVAVAMRRGGSERRRAAVQTFALASQALG
jgi:ribosomal protein S18 acetylase RimI-like enzyme